jgi:hypothetical protein
VPPAVPFVRLFINKGQYIYIYALQIHDAGIRVAPHQPAQRRTLTCMASGRVHTNEGRVDDYDYLLVLLVPAG